MTRDESGEIYNSPSSFKDIADEIRGGGQCIFGWTDQEGTHFDILMSTIPQYLGGGLQGGVDPGTDLFVNIMRKGCFGFDATNENENHPTYVAEKLFLNPSSSDTKKISDLINGVIKELNKDEA